MFNTYIVIHQQKQKQFFPQKICFPKGNLPLKNEIAVVMSKAFGQRKRKFKLKKYILHLHQSNFDGLWVSATPNEHINNKGQNIQYTDYVHCVHKLLNIGIFWEMIYN